MFDILLSEQIVWAVIAALSFMVLDIVSGFLGAVATGSISSSKMWKGLMHKGALIIVLVCAAFIDLFTAHVPGIPIPSPLLVVSCVIIICMEVVSILENVSVMYPDLANSKLLQLFAQTEKKDEENGERLE